MTLKLPEAFLRLPIAHRALHDLRDGRPENSRAAIRAAIKAGYAIEIDVQLTSDDQAVVFHDDTLDRLTGLRGAVRAHSAADLAGIALRGGDEAIPDLPEILGLVAGQVPLVIEIKDQDGAMGPDIGPLEEAVADAVASYEGPLALMSFNPHSVARMARLAPDLPRGLVTGSYKADRWKLPAQVCNALREIPDFERCAACFISHEHTDLARARVMQLKSAGARVICWTIRSPEEEARARRVAENVTFENYSAAIPA
ncbi:glycerophosphodiester phosphodiesterase family protein [Sulfitobacter sp. LCG007]